jgi:hypothetical protein
MKPARRLASLALPIVMLVCLAAPRGAAQTTTNDDARFAFADTTLIRDTLGLTFERLFPLADSLRMTPERLRALSVTYRWTLARLIKMADSLDVPIDSVGPQMERERFNPLAAAAFSDQMQYTSTYSPTASGNSWNNDLDYRVSKGKASLTSQIGVRLQENGKNGSLGSTETRDAATTLNWRITPRLSVGGKADLHRFDNVTRSGVNGEKERINDFGFTANARPRPWMGITPSLTATGALSSIDKLREQKRGLNGTLTGSLRYAAGTWISHDLNFSGTSTISTASAIDPAPDDALEFPSARARDNSSTIRGTLNALRSRPVELNVNYSFQNTRTQSPIAYLSTDSTIGAGPSGPETLRVVTGFTNKNLTIVDRKSLDGTLRFRRGDRHSLDVTWKAGLADNSSPTILASNSTREDRDLSTTARSRLGAVDLDGSFAVRKGINSFPKRDFPRGGYREDSESRSMNGSAIWAPSARWRAEVRADISLNIARYAAIGAPLTVPVARDGTNQQYTTRLSYTPSRRLSNTVSLQVSRSQSVNLAAASTASNSEDRTYRGNWSWTCRLLEGLTATQNNAISAVYTSYPFALANNRVSLGYSALTTLDAVLGPKLLLKLDHNTNFQPSGNYRPETPFDPTEYFSRAEENQNYTLTARIYYTPIPAFSLTVTPDYYASDRNTSQSGVIAPQRETRTLKLSGTASLNLRVGARGRLSGDIARTFEGGRTINYGSQGGQLSRSERRSVNGNMVFTWTL